MMLLQGYLIQKTNLQTLKGEKMAQETVDITEDIMLMVETMEQINVKNLLWLKKNDKDLYKAISKLDKKLLKDKSSEKFTVELSQKGELDILNKKKNTIMYNQEPFIYGDTKASALKKGKYKSISFDGTGLGTQITSTIKLHKPKKVTIYEKDLEIFKCSLYITDYEELNTISKLNFVVGKKYTIDKDAVVVSIKDL